MKRLPLLLLLSLSFGVSAYTVTYDNMGRGSDGSKCKETSYGGIRCSGGDIGFDEVRYRQVGTINRYRGDDGSECKFNTIGRFICNRDSNNYNSNGYEAMTESTRQQGEIQGAAIGILVKSLIDAFSSSSTSNNSNQYNGVSTKIPNHSHFSGTGWKCNNGFVKSGNRCIKSNTASKIPLNAYSTGSFSSGDGWDCKGGYKKINNSCVKINNNTSSTSTSKKFMPPNSYMSSTGWVCKIGYVRNNNGCISDSSSLPKNATQVVDGWVCNYGYKKVSNTRCVKK